MFYRSLVSASAVFFLLVNFSACSRDGSFSLAKSGKTSDFETCLAQLNKKRYEQAIQCLESYKSVNLNSGAGAQAALAIGDAYFLKKDYLVAAESYNIFVESNPADPKVSYAYYRMGVAYMKAGPKSYDRDQQYLDHAIKALSAATTYYTDSPYTAEASKALAEARFKKARKEFYIGRFYYRYKEYLAAIPRFEALVTEYSKLGLDEQGFYYLVVSLVRTQQKDVAEKYFDVFKQFYPASPYVKKIARVM